MLSRLHARTQVQLIIGLLTGVVFGFLLHKGGVTKYDVIIGQLLLRDFTVVKMMLAAIITGMIGVHVLRSLGLAELHPKSGSLGGTAIGGLIFGVGFAVLGYCPGTVAGAVGNGYLDALVGGLAGILIGAGLFAALYPKLQASVLDKGAFGDVTWPRLLKVNPWLVVFVLVALLTGLLAWIESAGL